VQTNKINTESCSIAWSIAPVTQAGESKQLHGHVTLTVEVGDRSGVRCRAQPAPHVPRHAFITVLQYKHCGFDILD
jgi:hypothetical protein